MFASAHMYVYIKCACADRHKYMHVHKVHTAPEDPLLAAKIVHYLLELTWKRTFLKSKRNRRLNERDREESSLRAIMTYVCVWGGGWALWGGGWACVRRTRGMMGLVWEVTPWGHWWHKENEERHSNIREKESPPHTTTPQKNRSTLKICFERNPVKWSLFMGPGYTSQYNVQIPAVCLTVCALSLKLSEKETP